MNDKVNASLQKAGTRSVSELVYQALQHIFKVRADVLHG